MLSQQSKKEQKGWFLRMFLGTSGASLLRNPLASQGTVKAAEGKIITVQDF